MPTSPKHRARLGDLLVARGAITPEQLDQALGIQQRGQPDRLIGEILADFGFTTKDEILAAMAEGCGVPFVHLVPALVDPGVRGALAEAFIRKNVVLPLFRVREVLTVAMAEPSNLFLVDEIAHAAGLNVQVVAATADNIYQMIEHVFAADPRAPAAEGPAPVLPPAGEMHLPDDYDSVYGNWPPEKVAGLLVREAVRSRAGAIHIEPDEKVLRIRFDIDGVLHVVMRPPMRLAPGLCGAFEDMIGPAGRGGPSQEWRRSARLMVQGRTVQVHLVSLAGAFGLRTVVRLVRDEEAPMPLEKLGCDFEPLAGYRRVLAESRGLVLVAGPSASGVTTTLYGTLGALDPVRLNICTLEACIHFNLPGVNQFSPATCGAPDAGAVFPRLLLQRPDVLMLDDVLAGEVARGATEAAVDGGFVLAQTRGGDAADALARLAAHVPPDRLAAGLRMVLAQRLVRTICPHCRCTYDPPAPVRRRVETTLGAAVEGYAKGRGCPACGRTGYLGRIGLFELVPMAGAVADLLRDGADADRLHEAVRAAGHPSLWVDGMNKVRAGITTVEEVMNVLAGCPCEAPAEAPTPALVTA